MTYTMARDSLRRAIERVANAEAWVERLIEEIGKRHDGYVPRKISQRESWEMELENARASLRETIRATGASIDLVEETLGQITFSRDRCIAVARRALEAR